MGNLRRKKEQILLNSVDGDTIQVLANGNLFINEYGEITPSDVEVCKRTCTTSGTAKVVRVTISPNCPCNECYGYEGGIEVQKKYGLSGDPQNFYGHSKYYGHKITDLQTCVSGKLAAVDQMTMQWKIARLIEQHINSIVTMTQTVTLTVTGDSTITLEFIDGTTGVTSTTTTAALHSVNFDANSYLTSSANGNVLTITGTKAFKITLGAANVAFTAFWLDLTDKWAEHPSQITLHGTFGTMTVTTANVKPILPNSEVARVFPILPVTHVGTQPTLPLANTDYCKYYFKIIHDKAYDHSFANHLNQYYEEVEFYLPATVAQSANWEDKLVNNGACSSFDSSSSSSSS